jgi:hypothetical protein
MADQAASIFGSQTPGDQTTPPQGNGGTQNSDEVATLLQSIKNERGEPKYKTLQDALKALQHSQEFIPVLQQTKTELEQKLALLVPEVEKVKTLEAAVLELTQKQATQVTPAAGLTEEQVAELVSKTLTKTQQAQVQQTNLTTVANAVKQKYGDKAEEVFYGKAKELGMTVEEFNALAARTPKAVLTLVGAGDAPVQREQRSSTGFNSEGFTPPKDTMIGRNTKPTLIGATNQDLAVESANARKMVEELAEQGLSVNDLTDPKIYNKVFGAR